MSGMAKKQSSMMKIANEMARAIIADQTKARLAIAFDAAIIAANKVFHMGPSRAADFANAYSEALDQLADLYISDADDNRDKRLDYAKGTRDAIIRKIVGDDNFVPFDKFYGDTYMDEMRRIRTVKERTT